MYHLCALRTFLLHHDMHCLEVIDEKNVVESYHSMLDTGGVGGRLILFWPSRLSSSDLTKLAWGKSGPVCFRHSAIAFYTSLCLSLCANKCFSAGYIDLFQGKRHNRTLGLP